MGVITFLERMDASSLSISREEFDRSISRTLEELEAEDQAAGLIERPREPISYENTTPPMTPSSSTRGVSRRPSLTNSTNASGTSTPVRPNGLSILTKGVSLAQRAVRRFDQFMDTTDSDDGNSSTGPASSRPSPPPSSAPSTSNWSQSTPRRDSLPHPIRRSRTMSIDSMASLYTFSDAQSFRSRSTLTRSKDYDNAFEVLRNMFPNIDAEVCHMVLQAKRGHLPPAIEALLEISNSVADKNDAPQDEV
jgi:hypothetical protein